MYKLKKTGSSYWFFFLSSFCHNWLFPSGVHSSIVVPPSWIVKLPRKGSFKSSLRKSPKKKASSKKKIKDKVRIWNLFMCIQAELRVCGTVRWWLCLNSVIPLVGYYSMFDGNTFVSCLCNHSLYAFHYANKPYIRLLKHYLLNENLVRTITNLVMSVSHFSSATSKASAVCCGVFIAPPKHYLTSVKCYNDQFLRFSLAPQY